MLTASLYAWGTWVEGSFGAVTPVAGGMSFRIRNPRGAALAFARDGG